MLSLEERRARPHNNNGGLTLIPMPGFEEIAKQLKGLIEKKGLRKTADYPEGRITPVDIAIPVFGTYVNGEPQVGLGKKHVGGHDCYVITSGPGTCEMLTRLLFLIGCLKGRRARRITIMTGYFPLGRSDKIIRKTNEFPMPPIFVRALKAVGGSTLDRMVCVDPHCEQISGFGPPGFISPVEMTYQLLSRMIDDALKIQDRICVAFPDGTARKRFKETLRAVRKEHPHISIPVVTVDAEREDDTEKKIEGVTGSILALKDAIVLAPDDETATGGTQINAAELYIKDLGAKEVWAGVTHAVMCGNAAEKFAKPNCAISRLYVTDTIPILNRPDLTSLIESKRLHLISWMEEFALIIFYAHWDDDIYDIRGAH